MIVVDRSNGSEGSIHNFSTAHLSTSDRGKACAGSRNASVGDGPIQGRPEIPDSTVPEVATVEGEPVIYSGSHEHEEAQVGQAGLVSQGATALDKAITSRSDKGRGYEDLEAHKDAVTPMREQFEWNSNDNSNGPLMPSQGDSAGVSLALDKAQHATAVAVIPRQGFGSNATRQNGSQPLSMGQVMDRRRHPEKYAPIMDGAKDGGLPVKSVKAIATGDAVANPGMNLGRHGAV